MTHSDRKNLHDAMFVLIDLSKKVLGFNEQLGADALAGAKICEKFRDADGMVIDDPDVVYREQLAQEHQQLTNEEAPL
jgi:hypothetical protein